MLTLALSWCWGSNRNDHISLIIIIMIFRMSKKKLLWNPGTMQCRIYGGAHRGPGPEPPMFRPPPTFGCPKNGGIRCIRCLSVRPSICRWSTCKIRTFVRNSTLNKSCLSINTWGLRLKGCMVSILWHLRNLSNTWHHKPHKLVNFQNMRFQNWKCLDAICKVWEMPFSVIWEAFSAKIFLHATRRSA